MVNPEDKDTSQQGSTGSTDRSQSNDRSATSGITKQESRCSRARRRVRNRKQRERKTGAVPAKGPRFEGEKSEMAGHVFQTQKESSTPRQFKKTMEQLEHWVGLKTKFPEDLKPIFGDKIKQPLIKVPADLTEDEKKSAAKIDMMTKREMSLETSFKQLYTVVWGQCSKAMRAQIRADKDYPNINGISDEVSLLKIIRGICYSYESSKEVNGAVYDTLKKFYSFMQGEHMSLTEYFEEFLIQIDIVEVCSGTNIWNGNTLIKQAMSKDGK